MVDKSESTLPTSSPPGNATKPSINVKNHLSQRRAVAELLNRHRVLISSRRFHDGTMTARVLVGGELYDVDALQLEQLRNGLTPDDLMLDPVNEDED